MLEKDAAASARLRLRQTRGLRYELSAFLAHSGDSWFWLLGLFILWLAGSRTWHAWAALMAAGIIFLAGVVMGIKLLVRRRRPEGEWGAIYRNTDPHSFPSGHAARAVMLVVVAWGLGPAWLALLLLLWAPLVSLARVIMGVHYLSDIFAGMAVGALVGLGVLLVHPLLVALVPFAF
jgi:membrane-associated phospholipid phosphatase